MIVLTTYEHDGVCPFSIIDGGECSHYGEECKVCFKNSEHFGEECEVCFDNSEHFGEECKVYFDNSEHFGEECKECFENIETEESDRLSIQVDTFGMESLTENEQVFVEGRISIEEFDANR